MLWISAVVVKKISKIPKLLLFWYIIFTCFVCSGIAIPSSHLPGRSRCTAATVPGNTSLRKGANFQHLPNIFYQVCSRVSSLAHLCIITLENFGFSI